MNAATTTQRACAERKYTYETDDAFSNNSARSGPPSRVDEGKRDEGKFGYRKLVLSINFLPPLSKISAATFSVYKNSLSAERENMVFSGSSCGGMSTSVLGV